MFGERTALFLAGAALATAAAFLAGAAFFAGAALLAGAAFLTGAAFLAGAAFFTGAALLEDVVGTDLATFFTAVGATEAFFAVDVLVDLAAVLPTTLLTAFFKTEVAVFLALGAMSTIASLALLSRLGPRSE